jgi:hypothetical protein
MKCVVCTLFEHHYHFGAAVLINSLCHAGYTGKVYAGFRGPLPDWAAQARKVREGQWEMAVNGDVSIVFLALQTSAHFTNYKPDFLLQVEALAGGESEAAVYLDPDIVLNESWSFFEDWQTCGITVCEDVNSPLGRNHPRRIGWRRFFGPLGVELKFPGPEYANGGYLGIQWKHRDFLLTWQKFIGRIAESLGGMDVAGIDGGRALSGPAGFVNCLDKSDQDGLNAALEAHPEIPASFLGPAAMGFQGGKAILPHALGSAKPWRRRYVREALAGRPPSAVDKAFWKQVDGPLQPYARSQISWRRLQLGVGSALGRFMRRT